MINFKKHLRHAKPGKVTNPTELYESLDRASDKGPLRPAQIAVLDEWYAERRSQRDVIVKLHTGQGKTLIGLLMLQSQINATGAPALYVCPNNMLVAQTCDQAAQFGINVVTAGSHLPVEFADAKAILVASVQKVFNGKTQFGLDEHSLTVGTIVLDDSHACVESIKSSSILTLPRGHAAYLDLLQIFRPDLERQGAGTFREIHDAEYEVFLPVPYWSWHDKLEQVTNSLNKHRATPELKFAWPLLKDSLEHCHCIIAGGQLQVAPHVPPLERFGSFHGAAHRVFMSATVTDDSFLVKGLGLDDKTIATPVTYSKEKWSGEKMILMPSLISPLLDREAIIAEYAPERPAKKAKYGVAVLTPSFKATGAWAAMGARVATTETISSMVQGLVTGYRQQTAVFANRYDGIDLPDDSCRILIPDSRPRADTLLDRYDEKCRPHSEEVAGKAARVVEQGLGRSVRGERDYSVILVTGADLVSVLRSTKSRMYLSDQTRVQIEVGLEASALAQDEVESGGAEPIEALRDVAGKCLLRDPDWKEFYVEKLNAINPLKVGGKILGIFIAERQAERAFQQGDTDEAVALLQSLVDKYVKSPEERGWYLQEMARYKYRTSQVEANQLQIEAHKLNRNALKPREGLSITQIGLVSTKRTGLIIKWLQGCGSYDEANMHLHGLLQALQFGTEADRFEAALDEVGRALGFETQRPDNDWGAGPDNLWAVRQGQYLMFECKSEVLLTRPEIYKAETGQMNNSSAWFAKQYPGASVRRVLIIPAAKLGKGAGFTDAVEIMRQVDLRALCKSVAAFFREFKSLNFKSLADVKVQAAIALHKLREEDMLARFTTKPH
jgi:replicative superfamily II helicase